MTCYRATTLGKLSTPTRLAGGSGLAVAHLVPSVLAFIMTVIVIHSFGHHFFCAWVYSAFYPLWDGTRNSGWLAWSECWRLSGLHSSDEPWCALVLCYGALIMVLVLLLLLLLSLFCQPS